MKDIRGKNVILTGASRGIGVYIARTLAQHGARIALAARSADALEETRRACESVGAKAIAVACDVGRTEDLRRLVETAERELGPVDILVNNAGIEFTEEFQHFSTDQIDEIVRVNLIAPMTLSKLVLPGMLARKSGAIVNVASLAGKSPTAYATLYSATKHGLVGFSDSLGGELHGTGVHVASVCPGFVSDAGMYAVHVSHGAKAPPIAKPVAPQKVADAVIKAIKGAPEVLVSAGPMRPLLLIGTLSPRLRRSITRVFGVDAVFKGEADKLKQGHDRPGSSARAAASQVERETADIS
jgi:short-subunit dehydrogenase